MSDDPNRLPPGHVERRAVSNEVLAFQMTTLQDTMITNNALLRDMIREGFAEIKLTLAKHTDQIEQIKLDLARMDARQTALERFQTDQVNRNKEADQRMGSDAAAGDLAADELRSLKQLGGLLIAVLGAVGTLVAIFGLPT